MYANEIFQEFQHTNKGQNPPEIIAPQSLTPNRSLNIYGIRNALFVIPTIHFHSHVNWSYLGISFGE